MKLFGKIFYNYALLSHFRGLYFEAIFTAMTMGIVVMFKVEYVFLCIPIFVCRKVLVVYRRPNMML